MSRTKDMAEPGVPPANVAPAQIFWTTSNSSRWCRTSIDAKIACPKSLTIHSRSQGIRAATRKAPGLSRGPARSALCPRLESLMKLLKKARNLGKEGCREEALVPSWARKRRSDLVYRSQSAFSRGLQALKMGRRLKCLKASARTYRDKKRGKWAGPTQGLNL
jgi:hypothetical protein